MTTEELTPEQEQYRYERAVRAMELEQRANAVAESAGHFVNGSDSKVLAVAFGREHPYLLNELTTVMAIAVLMRTSDRLCAESNIRMDRIGGGPHPEHDGRIGCGAVVGALRTLGTFDGDPLVARRVWLARLPGWEA